MLLGHQAFVVIDAGQAGTELRNDLGRSSIGKCGSVPRRRALKPCREAGASKHVAGAIGVNGVDCGGSGGC